MDEPKILSAHPQPSWGFEQGSMRVVAHLLNYPVAQGVPQTERYKWSDGAPMNGRKYMAFTGFGVITSISGVVTPTGRSW